MPELPEVETIAQCLRQGNALKPSILGMRIREAQVLWGRTLVTPMAGEFLERVVGQTILEVNRRGKFLILQLSNDCLLFHLRMSGDLLLERVDLEVPTHHRLLLNLEKGWRLAFNDTRKFGRAWLISDPEEVLNGLGPEPLDPSLTPDIFHHRLIRYRRQLKPLLLDQSFLAGLGNIYSDEALHLARLHPLVISNSLNLEQSMQLLESIRQVLQMSINHQGASIDWVYRGGNFQNLLNVYRRTGEPCRRCGSLIQRLVIGQRSTHFCAECQPAPTPEKGNNA